MGLIAGWHFNDTAGAISADVTAMQPLLIQALSDPDPKIKLLALSAIARLGKNATKETKDAVSGLSINSTEGSAVRRKADSVLYELDHLIP